MRRTRGVPYRAAGGWLPLPLAWRSLEAMLVYLQ